MTRTMSHDAAAAPARDRRPDPDGVVRAGVWILRWSLVVFIVWFGAFKFTAAEAAAIQPLVANSPLLSWLYDVASIRTASRIIGIVELGIAVLIALRSAAPTLSAAGSAAAIGMFLTTLSFTVTTPGVWVWVEGFLVPSDVGGFVVKDVFLLGAAIVLTGDALAARPRPTRPASVRGATGRS